ncbi:glucose-6-phosphate isomerase [Mycoplasma sp. ATU-Cv-703]|uniref:glucose-6-phosphate isomerase n=1 Tax=Mycoplasma sp. ATU-Cv-703 TaxID=2498595 RepID=UPI000FDF0083
MIKLDLSQSGVLDALPSYHKKVAVLAQRMETHQVKGDEFLGWKDLPNKFKKTEFQTIKNIVKSLKNEGVNVLVLVGIGGSFAGAKAGLEMMLGTMSLTADMEVIFIGESLSSTDLAQKLAYLEDKNFAINVISKSGQTLEPAVAFKIVRKLLESKVGHFNAHKYIIATTDANRGHLIEMARENSWQTLVIPDQIGGRFSVLTAVGLFPLACAGIDIDLIAKGARKGYKLYRSTSLEQNDAYKYAVARHILAKKYPVELMVQYEPQMRAFSEWWKQLAGESEGKNGKGVFPASAVFSTDLHSLGQFIQSGSRVLFETMLVVENPLLDLKMFNDPRNADRLNYVANLTLNQINQVVYRATSEAHFNVGKVPIITIKIKSFQPEVFGQLVYFFQRAIAMSAYLNDVNPFDQPGVEIYKQNIRKLLQKIDQ